MEIKKMAVFSKKDEKIKAVFAAMVDINDMNEFKAKFKEMYPDEWNKIWITFKKEEAKTPAGKSHPMLHPEKYLDNMYKVWKNKQ